MQKHSFSADRPITSVSDDLLDRGRFAHALATAISSWEGKDSLIVAVHGNWGSGKSSVKNMALSIISKLDAENAPLVINFNPWEWAGQDKISKSFFDQLAVSLGQKDQSKERKKLAKKIRRYGLYLNSGATLVSGFNAALPTLFAVVAMLGIGSIFTEERASKEFLGFLLVVTVGWAGFLRWGGNLSEKLARLADSDNEVPLEKFKERLAQDLRKLKKPIVVVIDDIDRLTAQETRVLFQVVKANADFPNVVYLLLFQRDIVEKSLGDGAQTGRDYLEKIVQVPFDIPTIEESRLHGILFAGLDRILEEDPVILKRFDRARWENLFYGTLHHFFKSPRNVYRYLSTLSFYVSLLKGEKAFEVNPVDLIGIECLRVFEPEIYRRLSMSKRILTSTSTSTDRRDEERVQREFDHILSHSAEANRSTVRELLKQLFPPIERAIGGFNYGADHWESWSKELRVCDAHMFPRYFQLSIPKGDISESDIQELINLAGDRGALVERFQSLKEAGLLKAALSRLDTYKQEIPLQHSDSFVSAIMDVGDETEDDSGGFTGFSAHLHLVRIVIWYLRQEQSTQLRGKCLLSAFSKTNGLSVMGRLLSGEDSRRAKKDHQELLLTTDEQLGPTKSAFISKLESTAEQAPESLLANLHLGFLLFRWSEWGDLKKAQAWADGNINSCKRLLMFLSGLTTQVVSQGLNDHVARIKYRINLSHVEKFLRLAKVDALRKSCEGEALTERDGQVMAALEAALKRRTEGPKDDSLDDDE